MSALLDNIVWHTLCGPHAAHAAGSGDARRYLPGFVPFVGFADPAHPALPALASHVEPGELLYCDGWAGAAPPGWTIVSESVLCKMTWDGGIPAANNVPDAAVLDARHAAAALALAALTQPGPFSLKSIALGEYLGVFEGSQLVAMAGARVCAGGFREISGVCTHPGFRGRGLARSLVVMLLRRQTQRGEIPFLRVMRDNGDVSRFYRRLGFRDYRESVARSFSRDA
ncbi:MAG TPA: GNAT family N-acetyltransferase [Noviherbaspirillum sp.]|uniref:GNAT family N-acetyltransferase n=1 Tax=Noviherbaspirillum sp. TaxID=1926288 RepID=UPI002D42BE51|nr:GNAT family N-acetyltransferase [Noviherbaspirillum sp.]HYD94452.1 GNAT family N-acetyltransferase [Noviherbaspirillum sp.]